MSAPDLASLPSIVQILESGMVASAKDVTKAILSDIPVHIGELQQIRGERSNSSGSSFLRTLRVAREVIPFKIIGFSF